MIASALVIGVSAFGAISIALADRAANESFGEFSVVCEGKTRPHSAGKKLAVFSRDSTTAPWEANGNLIRGEALATTPAEVGAVVCLEPSVEQKLESCAFRSGLGVAVLGISVASVATGDATEYPRIQHKRPVRVITPSTGKTLAAGEVAAALPRACDQSVGKPSAGQFYGDLVDDNDIAKWIGEHVKLTNKSRSED